MDGGNDLTSGPITIYTVNYPLQYFAQRIGKDQVKVVFPAPRDADPADWMPDAQVLADYQRADLILLNGASYAKWTATVSLPQSKLVVTSASFRGQYITAGDGITHTHGPTGEHSHPAVAFTTWLDPHLAVRQAEAIRARLVFLRPQFKSDFDQGFNSLNADLDRLDSEISSVVARNRELPIFFSHPVYQYLIRRYELNAVSLHWEPNEMPSEEMWQKLDALLKSHPAQWMIWENAPGDGIVSRLEERGVKSIVFAPCGNVPADGDYLARMHRNIANLAVAFGGGE